MTVDKKRLGKWCAVLTFTEGDTGQDVQMRTQPLSLVTAAALVARYRRSCERTAELVPWSRRVADLYQEIPSVEGVLAILGKRPVLLRNCLECVRRVTIWPN